MVAVSSDWFSCVNAKPPENSTTIFRPGLERRFFARLRTASSMLRAPKSAAALAVRLGSGVGPCSKSRNLLFLVVLKYLEIILGQVADVVALLVRHHGIDEHQF